MITGSPPEAAEAWARYDRAEDALARVRAAMMAGPDEAAAAEQQFEEAYAAVEAAEAELDALTPSAAELASAANALAVLQQQARQREVVAPA